MDFEKMHKELEEQHERTTQYWEWMISEGPCAAPLDDIRSAVQTLMAAEREVLNLLKRGEPLLSEKAMATATRLENRAYHLISHNLLVQILEGVRKLDAKP